MLMTFRIALAAIALNTTLLLSSSAATPDEKDTAAITQQLNRYEKALNASDTDRVMALYADDAVFMPQNSPPSVGRRAIQDAYKGVFNAIKLNIRFQIDEIRVLSPNWAYARTRSTGTAKVLAGERPASPEANHELFLLHREADGQWRFARYIFSTTNPQSNDNQ